MSWDEILWMDEGGLGWRLGFGGQVLEEYWGALSLSLSGAGARSVWGVCVECWIVARTIA